MTRNPPNSLSSAPETAMSNRWTPVTAPATTPDRDPLERVEFHLTDHEREQAARRQAELVLARNLPMKRGTP